MLPVVLKGGPAGSEAPAVLSAHHPAAQLHSLAAVHVRDV